MIKERIFRYGEHSQGTGILTLPDNLKDAPLVVLLNAGVLGRSEPYRLNVLAARSLAQIGYISLRVDLSGNGETPERKGMIERESVALDWHYIKKATIPLIGERKSIIMGLCSGADNGIKIAATDPTVIGLILLDAVSKQDNYFTIRTLVNKLTNTSKLKKIPQKISALFSRALTKETIVDAISVDDLRDEPSDLDLSRCFSRLAANNGRILAIFTSHAVAHYNQPGQFSRALNIKGLEAICQEFFWPEVQHIFPIQEHRDRLLATIVAWGDTNLHQFMSLKTT